LSIKYECFILFHLKYFLHQFQWSVTETFILLMSIEVPLISMQFIWCRIFSKGYFHINYDQYGTASQFLSFYINSRLKILFEMGEAKTSQTISVALLALVLLLSPIIIFLVKHATNTIQVSNFKFENFLLNIAKLKL
jgi:hypothetical protein